MEHSRGTCPGSDWLAAAATTHSQPISGPAKGCMHDRSGCLNRRWEKSRSSQGELGSYPAIEPPAMVLGPDKLLLILFLRRKKTKLYSLVGRQWKIKLFLRKPSTKKWNFKSVARSKWNFHWYYSLLQLKCLLFMAKKLLFYDVLWLSSSKHDLNL